MAKKVSPPRFGGEGSFDGFDNEVVALVEFHHFSVGTPFVSKGVGAQNRSNGQYQQVDQQQLQNGCLEAQNGGLLRFKYTGTFVKIAPPKSFIPMKRNSRTNLSQLHSLPSSQKRRSIPIQSLQWRIHHRRQQTLKHAHQLLHHPHHSFLNPLYILKRIFKQIKCDNQHGQCSNCKNVPVIPPGTFGWLMIGGRCGIRGWGWWSLKGK
eukprot:scaffold38049_cov44-Attheya_sp.AAC.1